jgi:hypothetical protein
MQLMIETERIMNNVWNTALSVRGSACVLKFLKQLTTNRFFSRHNQALSLPKQTLTSHYVMLI